MANRAFGLAAFVATAAGGIALGYLGERKLVQGPSTSPTADSPPMADELLTRPASGEPIAVLSPDGTRLEAQVSGPDDGIPVLFVHGMALGHEVWHHQRLALQDAHRVITFDLRGHGRSEPASDGDYSAGALADDVVAVLQSVVPHRRVVAVGHSIGGMSLLAALRHHPEIMRDQVCGIGLLSTAGRDVVGSVLRRASAVGMSMMQSAVIQSRLARWLRQHVEGPRSDRVTDMSFLLTRLFGLSSAASVDTVEFVDRLNRRVPATVLGALAQTLTTIDELDLLVDVSVPALVLVGDQDRLTPPAQAKLLVDQLADVEFVCVADAGHTAMVEQPEQVTDAIRGLITRAVKGPAVEPEAGQGRAGRGGAGQGGAWHQRDPIFKET